MSFSSRLAMNRSSKGIKRILLQHGWGVKKYLFLRWLGKCLLAAAIRGFTRQHFPPASPQKLSL
jgi:hypothetical protein